MAVFGATTGLCLATAPSDNSFPTAPSTTQSTSDLEVYLRIVRRIHNGEGYYDAAGRELRAHGYPTRSMFNWRPPLYAWLYGALPSPEWGQAILVLLVSVTLLLSCDLALREGGITPAVANGVLLIGAVGWCVSSNNTLSLELWAGTLITLSVVAYARDWSLLGVAAGLFALFYRELTLPYALVASGLALARGRRREAVIWAVGLGLWGLFLVSHGAQVASRITSTESPLRYSWIRFGGARFILDTTRMNILIMMLPPRFAAFYLPLALLGVACWRGEMACRVGLTVGLYVAAFAVVGNPFNIYWGVLLAPLLTFGVARSPAALCGLLTELLPRRSRPISQP